MTAGHTGAAETASAFGRGHVGDERNMTSKAVEPNIRDATDRELWNEMVRRAREKAAQVVERTDPHFDPPGGLSTGGSSSSPCRAS